MKKRLLLVLSAVLIAMHPLSILAADAEDYEILQEEYNELKSKYKKLKRKYNALKEKYEGSEERDQNQEEPPIIEESPNPVPEEEYVYETNGLTFTYLRSELFSRNGQDFIIVYFNFANNSGKENTAQMGASIKAFQNNIDTDRTFMYDIGINELELATTQIRSGGNADIAFAYKISGMSDVVISMGPLFNFSGEKKYEFVIHLPGMETELLS